MFGSGGGGFVRGAGGVREILVWGGEKTIEFKVSSSLDGVVVVRVLFFLTFLVFSRTGAIEVWLESGDSPVPAREELLKVVEGAFDVDEAANEVLKHYHRHGYPVVGVGVEDDEAEGVRLVEVDVSRFGEISAEGGEVSRVGRFAEDYFGKLRGEFVNQGELDELLEGFHVNPMHRVVPRLKPGEDGVSVDALLKVGQSVDQRFSAGFFNSGADPLPRERFWVQGEFADLGGWNSVTTAKLIFAPDVVGFHGVDLGSRFYGLGSGDFGVRMTYTGAKGEIPGFAGSDFLYVAVGE